MNMSSTKSELRSAFKSVEGEAEYLAAYEATMKLWPVPYEDINVESRFGRTHVVACGSTDAPRLVMLHCFFTSLTSWVNNVAALSRCYRVYAPDMMGQPSKSIPGEYIKTREDMVEWLSGLLDELEIAETDLVGYSYGGFAALNFVIREPHRINNLVLLSPAGGLVPLRKQFYIRGALGSLGQALHLGRLAMKSMFQWMFYKPNLEKPEMRQVVECIFNQMYLGGKHFRPQYTTLKNSVWPTIVYTDEELQALKSPTLLLIGQHEALYSPEAAAARAHRLIPHIQTEIIPGAGHDLPVTKAAEVNDRILGFLEQASKERPPVEVRSRRVPTL
jgi:pimeloyl-ACP methyl ester carboxylesterase